MKAKVIKVIRTEIIKGNGKESPVRTVIQYWTLNGKLIVEFDPYLEDTSSLAASEAMNELKM